MYVLVRQARQGLSIYIYHKDTTSKQYESALNDSVVERVDGEMIIPLPYVLVSVSKPGRDFVTYVLL